MSSSYARAEARKPSTKTFRAAESEALSSVSLKALTSTTDQNLAIACVRLPVTAKPRADGLVGFLFLGAIGLSSEPRHRPKDSPTFGRAEVRESHQGRGQVQRGGQPADGGEIAPAAVGPEEVQPAVALEAVVDAHAAAEVDQVGAAAHGNVLASVDPPAGRRILERAGPPAEPPPGLEQFDRDARLTQSRRRGQPGQAAADDGDAGCDREGAVLG